MIELILQKKENQYQKCIYYLEEAQIFAERFETEIAWINHHIAITNLNYGKIDLADKYNQLALEEYKKTKAQKGIADCLDLQGFIILAKGQNNLSNVKDKFNTSLKIREETGSDYGIFNSTFNLSIALWHEGKIIDSISQLIYSLSLLIKLSSNTFGLLYKVLKRILKFSIWTILNSSNIV